MSSAFRLVSGAVSLVGTGALVLTVAKTAKTEYDKRNWLFNKTEDVTDMARLGTLGRGRAFGRDAILTRLITQLSCGKGILLLSGKSGVGKTALIEEVAYQIAEGKIPDLANAIILRLKSGELGRRDGLSALAKELMEGGSNNLIRALINQLREYHERASGKKVILFIDEFHKLFETGDPKMFLDELPSLDTDGVLLVGASSELELFKTIQKAGEKQGCPLERRMTRIEIPEMSQKETICVIREGKNRVYDQHQITLTEGGIEAVVHLANIAQTEGQYTQYPDRAVKFLDQVISYTKRCGKNVVDDEAACAYVAKIKGDSLDSWITELTFLKEKADPESALREKYFRKVSPSQEVATDDFHRRLSNELARSQNGAVCFVKIDSRKFLEEAVSAISRSSEVFAFSVQTFWEECCSDNAHRARNISNLQLLESVLEGLPTSAIVFLQDADLLLRAWVEIESTFSLDESSEASSLPSLPPVFANAVSTASRALGIDLQEAIAPESIEKAKRLAKNGSASSVSLLSANPMLREFADRFRKSWLNGNQRRSIIDCPLSVDIAPLENIRRSRVDVDPERPCENLSVQETARWLVRSQKGSLQWIESLVFFVHALWDPSSRQITRGDLCYDLCMDIRKAYPDGEISEEELKAMLPNLVPSQIPSRKIAEFFTNWRALCQNAPRGDGKEIDEAFPELSQQFEQMWLQPGGSLLAWEGEVSSTGDEFYRSLIQSAAEKNNLAAIDYSLLKRTLPSLKLQSEYLSKIAATRTGILLITTKEGLANQEEFFQTFHREHTCHIFCFIKPPKIEPQPATSFLLSALLPPGLQHGIGQGLSLLRSLSGSAEPSAPLAAPPSWIEREFKTFVSAPFTKEQFDVFFNHLVEKRKTAPELMPIKKQIWNVPNELLQPLANAYFFLYTREKSPLSLDQIQQSLLSLSSCSSPEEVATALFGAHGRALQISLEEIRYAIDPNLTTPTYRILRRAQAITQAALSVLLRPFVFLGGLVKTTIHWIGPGIFAGIALPLAIKAIAHLGRYAASRISKAQTN